MSTVAPGTSARAAPGRRLAAPLRQALRYEAPWLMDKLVKEHIVESREEGLALFEEVKRFLVMSADDRALAWEMSSLRIDEVWHQFVLFTGEYHDFCRRFLGHYAHHFPGNAPALEEPRKLRTATAEEFAARYQELFRAPPAPSWRDEHSVVPARRLIWNDLEGVLTVSITDRDAELRAHGPRGSPLIVRVDRWAEPALRFLAAHDAFYVRELPGGLTAEEKVALCMALVASGRLRVAS